MWGSSQPWKLIFWGRMKLHTFSFARMKWHIAKSVSHIGLMCNIHIITLQHKTNRNFNVSFHIKRYYVILQSLVKLMVKFTVSSIKNKICKKAKRFKYGKLCVHDFDRSLKRWLWLHPLNVTDKFALLSWKSSSTYFIDCLEVSPCVGPYFKKYSC